MSIKRHSIALVDHLLLFKLLFYLFIEMIHSLFIINSSSDIFMEKHWKSVINRSVCDYFFECQSKCTNPEDIQAVIPTAHHQLFVVHRNKLFFVAVVNQEGIMSFY
jgi:hypothetical protein